MKKHTQAAFVLLWMLSAPSGQAGLIDLQLVINPIQICSTTRCANPGLETAEAITDKVWAQAGIDIHFLEFSSFVSPADFSVSLFEFDRIEPILRPGGGPFDIIGYREKDSWYDTAPGATDNINIVDLWFIDSITGGPFPNGIGGVADAHVDLDCFIGWLQGTEFCGREGWTWGNNIAVAQGAADARSLTIAHEIGHVLGLFHPDQPRPLTEDRSSGFPGGFSPPNNLMDSAGGGLASLGDIAPDGLGFGQLLDVERYGSFGVGSQIATARASPFLIPLAVAQVPIPSTGLLLAACLFLLPFHRARQESVRGTRAH